MKSVFIVYNQALGEIVQQALNHEGIRGFTMWEDVMGHGSVEGVPHMGTHVWPAMNSAVLSVIDDNKVVSLLDAIRKINQKARMQGIRAFVWTVEETV